MVDDVEPPPPPADQPVESKGVSGRPSVPLSKWDRRVRSSPRKKLETIAGILSFSVIAILVFSTLILGVYFRDMDRARMGIAPILSAIFLTASPLILLVVSISMIRRSKDISPEQGIEDRANEARDHLAAAAQLLNELGDELAVKTNLLEQREADARHYEQLASFNVEQAKAIEGLVGRQFARQSRVTWLQFGGSLGAAFVLGLVVNWISNPVLEMIFGK